MNAGVLPLLFLCAAVGMVLGFAQWRDAWLGIAGMAASAFSVSLMPSAPAMVDVVFQGLWLSVVATAALVHLPRGLTTPGAIAVGVNAGVWLGALAGISAMRVELGFALLLGLLLVPAKLVVDYGYAVAMKVISSWIIAIAALAMLVSLIPVPGYAPDHME